MTRPAAVLMVFAAVYGLLLALLVAVTPDNSGLAWAWWLACSGVCLVATAMELGLLVIWAWLRVTGQWRAEPYVPRHLSRSDRRLLQQRRPKVAMLMPAHREASTPEDAAALTARVVDILRKTPEYADLFLLFDSPSNQHANEQRVFQDIARQLLLSGDAGQADRIHAEYYRDKPPFMKNKPGSIHMWLERRGDAYPYMLVLDADSSLLDADPSHPETCDVVPRMVVAMEHHPQLAMIQSAIQVHTEPTFWGRFQQAGVAMAARYHGVIFGWILDGCVPSFGHNVLFRTADFKAHVGNTLQYLSHDFLDAADLASAGRHCIQSYNVVTAEEGEASLLGFLKRDLRWARGNAQWANYLARKPRLPLGPRIFIGIGILCYVWPLVASVLPMASVFLIRDGYPLIDATRSGPAGLLLLLVICSLVLPKILGSPAPAVFYGTVLAGCLMAPAVMLVQGILFLLGAFGSKWTIRGSRCCRMDSEHARGIVRLFAPVSLLGCLMWISLPGADLQGVGAWLLRSHILLLVGSPLAALAFSWPLPARA
jgi:membrane glycosyltransferase